MPPTKRSPIKKAAATVKKQAKTATKTATKTASKSGKAAVAKVKQTAQKTKAKATIATVRGKAEKVVAKARELQHDAAGIAAKIGSTMGTIGNAILSMVQPAEDAPDRKKP